MIHSSESFEEGYKNGSYHIYIYRHVNNVRYGEAKALSLVPFMLQLSFFFFLIFQARFFESVKKKVSSKRVAVIKND